MTLGASTTTTTKVLGVCGGIGSGKSEVCRLLVEELGCTAHLDADSLAHQVYQPNSPAIQEIANEFPADVVVVNGEIDRKALGAIVFSDPSAMSQLEQIVWPHVKDEIRKQINLHREQQQEAEQDSIVILEAAVLIDAGWMDLLDGLWVVQASQNVAMERLTKYRGLDTDTALQRIEAQQSRRGIGNLQQEVDQGIVSAIIPNDGDIDTLKETLEEALHNPTSWY